jgi:hypothetical protein
MYTGQNPSVFYAKIENYAGKIGGFSINGNTDLI